MSTHYTAVLEVNKTTVTEAKHDAYAKQLNPAARDVTELARVVVRADSLEKLIEKLEGHVSLLDD